MTIQNDATNKDENKEVNALQSKLSENMMSVFDFVLSDRSEYFAKNPEKIPDKEDVQSIINSYSQKNAAISCSVGLVPGPLGMIATIPEIFTLIRNQIAMIYDVGMAYGKSKVLNKELISGILISSMGVGAGSLLIMHGNKILVKRVSLRVFQKIIGMLAGRITQQALKSSISKWLPGVGAAAMGAWSHYSTKQVGKKAIDIFEKDIELSEEEVVDEGAAEIKNLTASTINPTYTPSITLDLEKIKTLLNLLKIDGEIKAEEIDYVKTIISNANLTENEKTELEQAIDKSEKFVVDYSVFTSSPDDAIGLLVDMVTLAKRDGTFHITEKIFIKQVGKLIGFSDSDIDELMDNT